MAKETARDQNVPDEYLSDSGNFRIGMDARYKSDLVTSALDIEDPSRLMTFDPKDAEKRLQSRGWIKFLERKREIVEAKLAKQAELAEAKEQRERERAEEKERKAQEKAAAAEAKAKEKAEKDAAAKAEKEAAATSKSESKGTSKTDQARAQREAKAAAAK